MRRTLAKNLFLRKVVIKALSLFPIDVVIRNPWTSHKLRLNSFRHKGYWFYRSEREKLTMQLFSDYIKPGDTVVEVGGHIGFITQYFSQLVGPAGKVYVFEPGSNNIRYIRANTASLSNVTVVEKAVSNASGELAFYEDDITGQNNSLLPDYKNLDGVARSHGLKANRIARTVQVVTLDDVLNGEKVDFVKIDIEGYELQALQGAAETLSSVSKLMVEVTENNQKVFELLRNRGFALYEENGQEIKGDSFRGNVFAIR
jgi:FkbM family methyltransferase